MRVVLVALLLGILVFGSTAHAQEWTDTRVGTYDFICETTTGVFVSGHQRFSLAARSCAAAKAANPTLDYQVRPASYKIALVVPSTSPPPTPPATQSYALAFDPTCSAIKPLATTVGVAFVSSALRTCLSGDEKDTAVASLARVAGDDLTANGVAIGTDGKISMPGTRAASGTLLIKFATAGGVTVSFERNWQVQP